MNEAGKAEAVSVSAPAHQLNLSDPNEMGRYSSWEFDFRQIEPGPPTTAVTFRAGSKIALTQFTFDRSFHQKGCSPHDSISFGLPVTPNLYSWREARIETPGFVNFGTGSEFDCVTGPGFVGLCVSFSPQLLEQMSARTGLTIPDDFLRQSMLPVRRRTVALLQLSSMARELLYYDHQPLADHTQEELVARIVSGVADSAEFDDRSPASARTRAVTRAIEVMQARLGDDLSVSQLCVDAGASWRTLSRGFRDRFGMGPKAYFNRLRLGRVRADLTHRTFGRSVADAANSWGFWHMGQFAKDYRRTFGELPSATLNRTKTHITS